MSADRVALAARNNALWCDAVCRAHGVPGEFVAKLWLNRRPVPRYYPNAITLSPRDTVGQRAWVEHLLATRPRLAVKDSFMALDLSRLGFDVLFEATWLWYEAAHPTFGSGLHLLGDGKKVHRTEEGATHRELGWLVVSDAAGLARWETVWAGLPAGRVVPGSERVFRLGLLHEAGVVLLAGGRAGAVVAVAAANQTGDVVGLSNVVGPEGEGAAVYAGAAAAVARLFPGRPIAGYEHGEALAHARAAGFVPVGPLRVWAK